MSIASDYWSRMLTETPLSEMSYWLAHPRVNAYYQDCATGHRLDRYPRWIEYCLGEFLAGRLPVPRMLEFGCGTGELTFDLLNSHAFEHFDGYDIASDGIRVARERARSIGAEDRITFEIKDGNTWSGPSNYYDVIWLNMSLHHIKAMEHLCGQLAQALKPDGYLFVNEYIGPNRFDFPIRQKEVMTLANDLLPQKYRQLKPGHPSGKQYRILPPIPNPREVSRLDPSESIRSAEITQILPQYFEIAAFNPIGGTILQFLLQDIAHNFRPGDPDSMRLLEILIDLERTLINIGDLNSDFAVIVGRPKK